MDDLKISEDDGWQVDRNYDGDAARWFKEWSTNKKIGKMREEKHILEIAETAIQKFREIMSRLKTK